jgi:GT2 family glycosyltransferase
MKKVAVIILNFKVAEYTVKAVQSVLKSTHKSKEIYVVDNNSGDDIEERLKKYPEVHFIQSGDNLGFAEGNNIGIRKALKTDADFIFILNPDAVVTKDTIAEILQGMEKYDAQIANPKIYFPDSKIFWFAGKVFDKANVLGSHRGVDQEDEGQFDEAIEMDDVTGAALMVERKVFEKIGLLDPKYFMYYEDLDFAWRAKKAGFKIMYLPKALVYHANAKSSGVGSPLQDYFITRNRMLFARKFLSLRTQFALLREAWRNRKIPTRKLALQDYLMGKFGGGSFIK